MLSPLSKADARPKLDRKPSFTINQWLRVALMVSLLSISAWIAIPLPFAQVPFTLQVIVVLLAPFLLGTSGAVIALAIYLLMGGIGLPVFSGFRGGLEILMGPSGGYLAGFLLAMPVIGITMKKNILISLGLGLLMIYACGIVYMMILLRLTFVQALIAGALPFLPWDLVKIILVRGLLKKIKYLC